MRRDVALRQPRGFVEHCLELLSPLGAVRARRMFGGHGLYLDELFVALIAGERLYLKVDSETREHSRPPAASPSSIAAPRRQVDHSATGRVPDEAHGVARSDAALGAAGAAGRAARARQRRPPERASVAARLHAGRTAQVRPAAAG